MRMIRKWRWNMGVSMTMTMPMIVLVAVVVIVMMIMVMMIVGMGGAMIRCGVAGSDADALDMMVMAFLRPAKVALIANDLFAIFA